MFEAKISIHTTISVLGHLESFWFQIGVEMHCWANGISRQTFFTNTPNVVPRSDDALIRKAPRFLCLIWYQSCLPIYSQAAREQNGHHLAGDIFKHIFLNEMLCIFIQSSLKYVFWGPMINMPKLVQMMAWRRKGDKPLSEPMLVKFTDAFMRRSALMGKWAHCTHHRCYPRTPMTVLKLLLKCSYCTVFKYNLVNI